jgi:hypothetical protein
MEQDHLHNGEGNHKSSYGRRHTDKSATELISELTEQIEELEVKVEEQATLIHNAISAAETRLYEKIAIHHELAKDQFDKLNDIHSSVDCTKQLTDHEGFYPGNIQRFWWVVIGFATSTAVLLFIGNFDKILSHFN